MLSLNYYYFAEMPFSPASNAIFCQFSTETLMGFFANRGLWHFPRRFLLLFYAKSTWELGKSVRTSAGINSTYLSDLVAAVCVGESAINIPRDPPNPIELFTRFACFFFSSVEWVSEKCRENFAFQVGRKLINKFYTIHI